MAPCVPCTSIKGIASQASAPSHAIPPKIVFMPTTASNTAAYRRMADLDAISERWQMERPAPEAPVSLARAR
jgi:hypothetical protein